MVTHKTNIKSVKKLTALPSGAVGVVRTIHHKTLRIPHEKLVARGGLYGKWHGKKHHGKVHAFTLAMYLLVAVVGASTLSQTAHAFNSWLQADWSGGAGTSATNQFESASNIITSTPGSLTPQDVQSDWCNTATCDSNWGFRRKLTIHNPTSTSTNEQVMIPVQFDPAMNADFSDLRFTTLDGADLPYYITRIQASTLAAVYVKTASLPAGYSQIYGYYGNAVATSESNAVATLDFFEDWSHNLTSWDVVSESDPGAAHTRYDSYFITDSGKSAHLQSTQTFSRANNSRVEIATQEGDSDGHTSFCADGTESLQAGLVSGGTDQALHITPGAPACINTSTIDASGENVIDHSITNLVGLSEGRILKVQLRNAGGATFATNQSSNYGDAYWNEIAQTDTTTNDPTYKIDFTANGIRVAQIIATHGLSTLAQAGPVEYVGGKYATLTSAVLDVNNSNISYGIVNIATTGSGGEALLQVRAATQSDMSDAGDWLSCSYLSDGTQITSINSCVGQSTNRYIQYQLTMSTTVGSDLVVNSIGVEYSAPDTTAPSAPGAISATVGPSGKAITEGGWTNLVNGPNIPLLGTHLVRPVYSWGASTDNLGGSGVLGYCLYFGTDNSADPLTTKGLISSDTPIDVGNTCPYAVDGTSLDLSQLNLTSEINDALGSGPTYYLRVRALDGSHNVSVDTAQHSFRYDPIPPSIFAPQISASTLSQPIFDIAWVSQVDLGGGLMPVPFDPESGVAGIKYCLVSVANQAACYGGPGWYGAAGSPATDASDPTGAAPAVPALLHVDATSNPYIDPNGLNLIYIVAFDNAGNITNNSNGDFNPSLVTVINLHNVAPSAPLNLDVTPGTSTTNSFSFSWDAPGDLFGLPQRANYCWSVNILPDAQHCNFAGVGITSLSADAYATQPGLNTMYVVAKDEAGNVDYTHYASVGFTANTTAPGAPRNLDVIDASNKATSSWKLALSWDVPLLSGSGVSKYKIYRSVDDLAYSEIGSTTATSFVDSGLDQVTYYYKVKACDNANNCDAYSNMDSLLPTGRYTDPANLVAGPQVLNLKTRSATIAWSTDRFSDSKLAYGTSSNSYFPAEAYQSNQVTGHNIELSNLSPGTTYFYRAKWTDNDGNTGTSAQLSFTTLPAPLVSDITVSSVNLDRASITFSTKGASKAHIYYGKTTAFGAVTSINTSTEQSTYSTELSGLDDGSKYFFKVNSLDSSGFEYDGSVISFTTIARPRISNVRFQAVDGEPSSTQKITWTTNVPASTEIGYGARGSKQEEKIGSTDLTIDHEMIVKDLLDDTEYTLTARSRDTLGNVATSDVQTFHTALDTRPPKITDLNLEASIRGNGVEARGQIIVTWKTDEPSTSQVSYGVGTDGNFTNKTAEVAQLTTDHIVIISDLSTSSVYSIKAISHDKGGNPSVSNSQSVVVGRGTNDIFSIIFGAIQQIFGFKL